MNKVEYEIVNYLHGIGFSVQHGRSTEHGVEWCHVFRRLPVSDEPGQTDLISVYMVDRLTDGFETRYDIVRTRYRVDLALATSASPVPVMHQGVKTNDLAEFLDAVRRLT